MKNRNAYEVLVGKPEGKKPLGRPRRRRRKNTVSIKARSFLTNRGNNILSRRIRIYGICQSVIRIYISKISMSGCRKITCCNVDKTAKRRHEI
jgi:hypothetical protein